MRLVRPAWAAAYLTASLHAPRLHCTATGSHSVASALADIHAKIAAASAAAARPAPARLVAVSKTKPDALLLEAYAAGHRAFGENYVQELVRKAAALPADIEWHFIGKLQSNKCKALVDGVPNLHVVETVDSERLASKLDAAVARSARAAPLGVMIQVNTSPWEGTKNGVMPSDVPALAELVIGSCPHLKLMGLMTIGAPGEAACFGTLRECREALLSRLNLPPSELLLSMGMSNDFEEAIAGGSDSVRVGSSIFGARDYPPKSNP